MNSYKKAIKILTKSELYFGLLIVFPVIGMAILEAMGVASVMPFLAVIANPEILQTNLMLNEIYTHLNKFGVRDPNDFLILLGIGIIMLMIISAFFRAITTYVVNNFIEMLRHTVGTRLLETYLQQSYDFFLNRHSGDMSKTILSEADQFVSNVVRPAFNMIANSFVVIAVTTLLIFVNPWLALSAAGLIGGIYTFVFLGLRYKLSDMSAKLVASNKERFTSATEALGAIKEIKILGCEKTYLNRFVQPSELFAKTIASHQTISQIPRYVVEAFAFSGLIATVLILMITSEGKGKNVLEYILPIAGLFAYSAYRLQPALQSVYSGFVGMRYSKDIINNLYSEMNARLSLEKATQKTIKPLKALYSIEIQGLSYTYPLATRPALKNLNFSIPVGSLIGIVGSSGAGKTTLIDLILGLLSPSQGCITVDGTPVIGEQVRSWQQSLGYVPQEIFLTDGSIAENIALGVPKELIDLVQVERCAKMANIHSMVIEDMPDMYETSVGERGIRLSGGQRQRIGIARALYRNPEVLVLDEATSALDVSTERSVMDAINELAQSKTILIITHRLSTVKNCDQIYMIEQGEIRFSGSYTKLQERIKKA